MQTINLLQKYNMPWSLQKNDNGRHQINAQNGNIVLDAKGTPLGLRDINIIEALEFLCTKTNKTESVNCHATPIPWHVEITGEDIKTIKILAANGNKIRSSIAKTQTVEEKIKPHYDFIVTVANS